MAGLQREVSARESQGGEGRIRAARWAAVRGGCSSGSRRVWVAVVMTVSPLICAATSTRPRHVERARTPMYRRSAP